MEKTKGRRATAAITIITINVRPMCGYIYICMYCMQPGGGGTPGTAARPNLIAEAFVGAIKGWCLIMQFDSEGIKHGIKPAARS